MSAWNAETRWVWCACVLVVAGCNQIFGNNQVTPIGGDANQPGIDAPYGLMSVTYAVEASPHDALHQAQPEFTPFDTVVHVGPLDPANHSLDDLTVSVVTAGSFTVPTDTLTSISAPRYRLIYTRPDGLDVELQSSVKNASLVVPRIGRLDRVNVAAASDLSVAFSGGPDNTAGSWTHGRIIGTGLWSIFELGRCCMFGQPVVDYSTFLSMSGPLGAPQAAATDTLVFTDSNSDSGGTYDGYHDKVYGYATVTLDGFDGSGAPINPTVSNWKTPPTLTSLGVVPPFSLYSQRVLSALNDTTMTDTVDYPDPVVAGGVIATDNVMPFTDNLVNQAIVKATNGDLDRVVFAPLGRSLGNPIRFINPYNGIDAPAFPTAVYLSGSVTRMFEGTSTSVRSGIQVVALQTDKTATTPDVNFGDGVGLATGIAIGATNTTMMPATKSLVSVDNVTVNSPLNAETQSFDLTFASDSTDPNAAITDCTITLYQIESTMLTPVRRYLINTLPNAATGAPVIIDARLFDFVHSYTFGISCYHGHPNAITGDWRSVTFPFAVSTIYSHSFTVAAPVP
ncbi:MAG: hypothetical protein ABI591_10550 [Kofleriaceae bacterium]